jgi:hypothetical protein
MDVKQFNLFQQTMQYAADEDRRVEESEECVSSGFNMSHWLKITGIGYRAKVETVVAEGAKYNVLSTANAMSCGTACCVAGTAIMLNGSDQIIVEDGSRSTGAVITEDGEVMSIAGRAAQLFGLDLNTAIGLFHMTENSFDEILERATSIAAREGHELVVV